MKLGKGVQRVYPLAIGFRSRPLKQRPPAGGGNNVVRETGKVPTVVVKKRRIVQP